MPYNPDSEDALELAVMALFETLGWETVRAYHEAFSPAAAGPGKPYLGRASRNQMILAEPLREALARLNPGLPEEALAGALAEIRRSRAALSLGRANQELSRLLRDGVKVPYRDEKGRPQLATVRLIDWREPANNSFRLVSQLWVTGELYTRRLDLTGFVNGLPLLFLELKASHVSAHHAYRDNFSDYKENLPALFWPNGLVILSNGIEARVGSLTAAWEHFAEWKRPDEEGEAGVADLETTLRATCPPARLLDLVENFSLFAESEGGLHKIVAKNHQYLGVNKAVEAVAGLDQNGGRLGVFWHTQGSGKSYSMIFFAEKVLRRLPGNWTFLIVTDRQELDAQIYKTFARAGVVTEPERSVRAQSGDHLEILLNREDHRYLFSLIHKFNRAPAQPYSLRADIIVIVDEAHRTQYDTLAMNMRAALPNAAFIAFTGTPLIAGEERTREVFGDYLSVYNFRQSMADQATVPLYYENRIPELQIINDSFNREIEQVLEAAALSDEAEARLEQQFRREYQLITRQARLERIAQDIVEHFTGRAYRGKAMVVAIDKLTAVRLYDGVQAYWQAKKAALAARLVTCDPLELPELERQLAFMAETDMAVVVSPEQNELQKFRQKGLDIRPHRERLVKENLEERFKAPEDPLRLVFVCAMWITGFDVPTCSTIYLDKPMRNHTLMQTITRANRVAAGKNNGLIVDYIGVFRSLQAALAIYAGGPEGTPGDTPVQDKQALLDELRRAIETTGAFCARQGVVLPAIAAEQDVLRRIRLKRQARDALLVNDTVKIDFLEAAAQVNRLYKAILPDPAARQFQPQAAVIAYLAAMIRATNPEVDLSAVLEDLQAVLDRSITPLDYIIREDEPSPSLAEGRVPYLAGEPETLYRPVDLSQIDFEALARQFQTGYQHTEVEKLRGAISRKLGQMIRLNRGRLDYQKQFQQLIDDYNSGSRRQEETFAALLALAQSLTQEEQRHLAEGLSEEELALFDLLLHPPELGLSQKERQAVKGAVQTLLAKLKEGRLGLDWRKRQQAQAQVLVTIKDILDEFLPPAYTPDLYEQKCEQVYQHLYEHYYDDGGSAYTPASAPR